MIPRDFQWPKLKCCRCDNWQLLLEMRMEMRMEMTQQADLRSSVDGAGVWRANIVRIDEHSEIRVLESWMATVLRQRDGQA